MSEAILGISAFYHDSAAAIIVDGQIVAAAQEERFTRIKQDSGFPHEAVKYCLSTCGLSAHDLKAVVFYDKPWSKFERLLENYLAVAPQGLNSFLKAIPVWLKDKLWLRKMIDQALGDYEGELLFARHHESHAASAFYPSPFEEAAVLTLDGVGEWHTTTWGIGRGSELKLTHKIDYPHSLGLLYSAFTYYTGFKVNSGEYKVMGLAPYGQPKYVDVIFDKIISVKEDGSYRLHMEYFDFHRGLKMTSKKFDELFGGPPREPESEISQKEMDLARSLQDVIDEIVVRIGRHVRETTGQKNLCLAGGVALNCVANGRLQREKIFDKIWIQPASGDAGGSLGAALFAWYELYKQKRVVSSGLDAQQGSRLGPKFTRDEIMGDVQAYGAVYHELKGEAIYERAAELLGEEKVIGWFQGRMEFGPRALGGRSIIGDPRSTKMQSIMNLKIKYRESFRPFAPSVLAEKVSEVFETDDDSPYMLLVHPVHSSRRRKMTDEEERLFGIDKLKVSRSDLPAITHVDYSARIQSVHRESSPEYYQLIDAFYRMTDCPLIINTSFNVRGEPIVCTPNDAYRCFMRTEMDVLIVDDFVFYKEEQPEWKEKDDWKDEFKLD